MIDKAIMSYLNKNDLGVLIQENNPPKTTRELWMYVSSLTTKVNITPYEEYFNDAWNFWQEIQNDKIEESINNYLKKMKEKYDHIFVDFMECQGFPMYVVWLWWGKTSMSTTILKTLNKHHAEYRKTAVPIKGITTFASKLSRTIEWEQGTIDNEKSTVAELQNRRKRRGDGKVHLPNSKRPLMEIGAPSTIEDLFPNKSKGE